MRPLVVIAGPTASGKTHLALELARRVNGELVGADSVQIYRGFDIGSAKPTNAELGTINHHLIDTHEPDERVDAMHYAELADAAIENVQRRKKTPLVVGGTGLWLRALTRGLLDLPAVDTALRAELECEARTQGVETLHRRLAAVDPISANRIHKNDIVRVVRALEVFAQTGTPLGALHTQHKLGALRYRTLFIVLESSMEKLTERIEHRIQKMIASGWFEETRALHARYGDTARALNSVGYREIVAHLKHGVSKEETLRLIRKSTRLYARRQRNWFRGEPDVHIRADANALEYDPLAQRIRYHVQA